MRSDIWICSQSASRHATRQTSRSAVCRYAEDPSFEVLLFAWSEDGGEVQVADLALEERISGKVLSVLTDSAVEKWAYNAVFERICLSRMLGIPIGTYLDPT